MLIHLDRYTQRFLPNVPVHAKLRLDKPEILETIAVNINNIVSVTPDKDYKDYSHITYTIGNKAEIILVKGTHYDLTAEINNLFDHAYWSRIAALEPLRTWDSELNCDLG